MARSSYEWLKGIRRGLQGVFLIRCDLSLLLPFPPLAELFKAEVNDSETVHQNPDPQGVCAVWVEESE